MRYDYFNSSSSSKRVKQAISDLKKGELVILVDDEDREDEGDLVCAASMIDASKINFMAKVARGLICLSLPPERVEQLGLEMMPKSNRTKKNPGTAFTVSIDARRGISTGISAADRARTIAVACADQATGRDLVTPGHMFPIRAEQGGVLTRRGHTEGSTDLVQLAGLGPGAVICEIMNDDGTMARIPELHKFAVDYRLTIVYIEDIAIVHKEMARDAEIMNRS